MVAFDRELVEAGWEDLADWLPSDLDDIARSTGALRRRREIRSGEALLRMALGYSVLDLSLRSTAAWMAQQEIAEVSDVAVLKRLRQTPLFLREVLTQLLEDGLTEPVRAPMPYQVLMCDATSVSEPGSTGTDWRVHVGYDVARGRIDRVEVTDVSGGEHLQRMNPKDGDLLVTDRGYSHPRRIVAARLAGAHVLVRIKHCAMPMYDEAGERIEPLQFAQRRRSGPGRPPRIEERPVKLRAHGTEVDARLIVIRRSREETEREQKRLLAAARRKGRTLKESTLAAAAYVFLLTTVPLQHASASVLAELYRVRWQVELLFRRLKSLLNLDALRAHDDDVVESYLLGKLIAAVLVERIARQARAFSPWGVPLAPQGRSAQPMEMV